MQERLLLVLGGNAVVEADAVGEDGLGYELNPGWAFGAAADQVSFVLARGLGAIDEGMHNQRDALLPLHRAAAMHARIGF